MKNGRREKDTKATRAAFWFIVLCWAIAIFGGVFAAPANADNNSGITSPNCELLYDTDTEVAYRCMRMPNDYCLIIYKFGYSEDLIVRCNE